GVAYISLNNSCFELPAKYNHSTSSFMPSKGIACLGWDSPECRGKNTGGWFINPGSNDLRAQNFNDEMSSFQCKTA
ncbi:hypothetical protein FRC12_015753, partial [Ceratobasidium sp. 428]